MLFVMYGVHQYTAMDLYELGILGLDMSHHSSIYRQNIIYDLQVEIVDRKSKSGKDLCIPKEHWDPADQD